MGSIHSSVWHLGSLDFPDTSILDGGNSIPTRIKNQQILKARKKNPECACQSWTLNSEIEISANNCLPGREETSAQQLSSIEFKTVDYWYLASTSITNISNFTTSLVRHIYNCAVHLTWKEESIFTPAIAVFITVAASSALIVYAKLKAFLAGQRQICSGHLWHIYDDGRVRCAAWAGPVVGRLTPLNFYRRLNKSKQRSEQQAAQRTAIFASLDAEPKMRAIVLTPYEH